MHLNHLDVFYHVYREGGFHAASRVMHRSQPTLSTHIASLETELGTKLFGRRPFTRLEVADQLYRDLCPLYETLLNLVRKQTGASGALLRIGASEFVLREYLVPLLTELRRDHPATRFTLHAGPVESLMRWLREDAIDLAIAVVDRPPPDFTCRALVRLPVVLLQPGSHARLDARALWKLSPPKARLICPPAGEGVCRRFDAELRRRGVHWPIAIQASSTALVPWLVAAGHGVGLCVGAPGLIRYPGTRALVLDEIEPVSVVALWRGETCPALAELVEVAARQARTIG